MRWDSWSQFWGMLTMALAMWAYAIAIALYRVRSIILVRERHAQWVAELPEARA